MMDVLFLYRNPDSLALSFSPTAGQPLLAVPYSWRQALAVWPNTDCLQGPRD